ncbi:MAG: YbhB/YbcL family Raf kinase inhibitor-like protein, partial [Oscillospiraceae bacterium]
MKVTSSGMVDGVFDDRYGKRGTQFSESGIPTCSIPVRIEDAPAGTVSYALVLEDKDAYP